MAIDGKPPHFVLLPFLAQGHLLPMVDIAKLLAKRRVLVSILVTPKNGERVKKVIDRAIASGLSIQVFHLNLPCVEAGLPPGCEHFDSLPSMHCVPNFFTATAMLRQQVEEVLLQLNPTCLLADVCFPWATDMALKLRIPRLLFHGTSCFSLVCSNVLRNSNILEGGASVGEYIVVPDLPHKIEFTKAQLRGTADDLSPEWMKIWNEVFASEEEAAGIVANTFQELENEYVQECMKVRGKKIWCIGPVSLCNTDDSDKAERGNIKASIDSHDFLKWLDSHDSSSVLYVCLGSISRLSDAQLIELGLGLEASNRPFIWVIRHASEAFESWLMNEKFEERIGEKGHLIRGWAPQVLILSHPSVGGFITHCGWNSTLEGVTAGLPMITWPIFAEQFSNEKFIVSVIKTGIRVGVEVPVLLEMGEDESVQVKSDDVKMAIEKLMDGGEEGEERREKARKLAEMARSAVEEGGSSHLNITRLIQDMVTLKAKNGEQSANATEVDDFSSEILVQ